MQINRTQERTAGVGNWNLFSSDEIVKVKQVAQHWKAAPGRYR